MTYSSPLLSNSSHPGQKPFPSTFQLAESIPRDENDEKGNTSPTSTKQRDCVIIRRQKGPLEQYANRNGISMVNSPRQQRDSTLASNFSHQKKAIGNSTFSPLQTQNHAANAASELASEAPSSHKHHHETNLPFRRFPEQQRRKNSLQNPRFSANANPPKNASIGTPALSIQQQKRRSFESGMDQCSFQSSVAKSASTVELTEQNPLSAAHKNSTSQHQQQQQHWGSTNHSVVSSRHASNRNSDSRSADSNCDRKRKLNPTALVSSSNASTLESGTKTTLAIQTAPLCETPPLPTLTPVPLPVLHDHLLHITKKMHLFKLHIQDTERQMKVLQDRNDIMALKLKNWRDFRRYVCENENLTVVKDLLNQWIKEESNSEQSATESHKNAPNSNRFRASPLPPNSPKQSHQARSFRRQSDASNKSPEQKTSLSKQEETKMWTEKLKNQSQTVLDDTSLESFLKDYHAEYFMLHDMHSNHVGRYYTFMEQQRIKEQEKEEAPSVLYDDALDQMLEDIPVSNDPGRVASPIQYREQSVGTVPTTNDFKQTPRPKSSSPPPSTTSIAEIKLEQVKKQLYQQTLERDRLKTEVQYLKHQLKSIRDLEKNRIRLQLSGGGNDESTSMATRSSNQQYPAHVFEVQPSSQRNVGSKEATHLLERLKSIQNKYNSFHSISAKYDATAKLESNSEVPPLFDSTHRGSVLSDMSPSDLEDKGIGLQGEKYTHSLTAEVYNLVKSPIDNHRRKSDDSEPDMDSSSMVSLTVPTASVTSKITSPRLGKKRDSTSQFGRALRSAGSRKRTTNKKERASSTSKISSSRKLSQKKSINAATELMRRFSKLESMEDFLDSHKRIQDPDEKFSYDPGDSMTTSPSLQNDDTSAQQPRPPPPTVKSSRKAPNQRRWKSSARKRPSTSA